MLALAGTLQLNGGPPPDGVALRMSAAQRPATGGREVHTDGPAQLAARGETGPATVARDGEVWVALDGYAHRSVEEHGIPDSSGAAAALHAYRAYGSRLARALAGNFALVLWDGARRRLLLIRDHAGTRSLFWARRADTVFFASELRGVLAGLPTRPPVDELQLASHLSTVKIADLGRTFYRGVSRVPAEHVISVDDGETRCERYSDVLVQPKLRGADHPAILRERLGLVADRATRGVRATLSLSGGLDSNAILAALTTLRPAGMAPVRVHAVTINFDRFPRADESRWVDESRARMSMDHEYISGDGFWPLSDYPATFAADDEPPPLFGMRGVQTLLEPARAAGSTVMLSGHGSDHLLLPSPLRRIEMLAWPWAKMRRELRDFEEVYGGPPPWELRHALQVLVSRHAPALLRLIPAFPDVVLLDPGYGRRSGLMREGVRLLAQRGSETGRLRASREASGQACQRLNEHVDRLGREDGIEWRYPFFDRDLMAAMMRIPADEAHGGGWLKGVLRRTLEGAVPDAVVKKARPTPHDQLFLHGFGEGGADALETLMRGSHLDRMGALSEARFWKVRGRMLAGGQGLVPAVSSAVSAEIWLRRELDGAVPSPVPARAPAGRARGSAPPGRPRPAPARR